MLINEKYIKAENGKGIYRKEDGSGPFIEVIMGLHQHNGIIRWETADDFEERDLVLEENNKHTDQN